MNNPSLTLGGVSFWLAQAPFPLFGIVLEASESESDAPTTDSQPVLVKLTF